MGLRKTIFGSNKVKIGDLSEKLVAYFKFDGNFTDSISGLTATTPRGTVGFDSGIAGQGSNFSPNWASALQIQNSSAFTFTDGVNDIPFSISYWIYSRDDGNIQIILEKFSAGTTDEYRFSKFSGIGLNVVLFTDQSNLIRRAAGPETLEGWTHYVATYDGSKSPQGIHLYRNGTSSEDEGVMEGNYTGMSMGNVNPYIGSANWTWLWWLNAKLDEFYIWKDRVLTPDEVEYVYNQGLTGKTII